MAFNDPENPEKARRAQDVEETPRPRSDSEFHGGRGVCILLQPFVMEGEGYVTGSSMAFVEGPQSMVSS